MPLRESSDRRHEGRGDPNVGRGRGPVRATLRDAAELHVFGPRREDTSLTLPSLCPVDEHYCSTSRALLSLANRSSQMPAWKW